jgi:hypothetical protein
VKIANFRGCCLTSTHPHPHPHTHIHIPHPVFLRKTILESSLRVAVVYCAACVREMRGQVRPPRHVPLGQEQIPRYQTPQMMTTTSGRHFANHSRDLCERSDSEINCIVCFLFVVFYLFVFCEVSWKKAVAIFDVARSLFIFSFCSYLYIYATCTATSHRINSLLMHSSTTNQPTYQHTNQRTTPTDSSKNNSPTCCCRCLFVIGNASC